MEISPRAAGVTASRAAAKQGETAAAPPESDRNPAPAALDGAPSRPDIGLVQPTKPGAR